MLLHEVIDALDARLCPTRAEAWDNPGALVLPDKTEALSGVTLAVDVSFETIAFAKKHSCNLLFTHHPAYIEPPASFGPFESNASFAGKLISEAAKQNIALYAAHTNLDKMKAAVDAILSECSLERANDDTLDEYGAFVRVSNPARELALHLSDVFGSAVQTIGKMSIIYKNAFFLPGSASSFIPQIARRGIDLLICGELNYHAALEAAEQDIACIICGHGLSEKGYVPYMEKVVKEIVGDGSAVFCYSEKPLTHFIGV